MSKKYYVRMINNKYSGKSFLFGVLGGIIVGRIINNLTIQIKDGELNIYL